MREPEWIEKNLWDTVEEEGVEEASEEFCSLSISWMELIELLNFRVTKFLGNGRKNPFPFPRGRCDFNHAEGGVTPTWDGTWFRIHVETFTTQKHSKLNFGLLSFTQTQNQVGNFISMLPRGRGLSSAEAGPLLPYIIICIVLPLLSRTTGEHSSRSNENQSQLSLSPKGVGREPWDSLSI